MNTQQVDSAIENSKRIVAMLSMVSESFGDTASMEVLERHIGGALAEQVKAGGIDTQEITVDWVEDRVFSVLSMIRDCAKQ